MQLKLICRLLSFIIAVSFLSSGAGAAPREGAQYKDWVVKCESVPGLEEKKCFIRQQVTNEDESRRVLNASVGNLGPNGQSLMILTLPLGIYLPTGVGLKIDEHEPMTLVVQLCLPNGCQAMLPLDGNMMTRLKAGSTAKIAFLDATRREVTVPISLSGFTAGVKALNE